MKEDIIIRNAKDNDFNQVHKLVMQVHNLHVNERSDIYKNVDPLCFEEFKQKLLDSNNIYLVAEIQGQIVGICFSQIKEIIDNKIMKDRKILHIEDICVDEKQRRNGIGKKLYNHIIQCAKENYIDNIGLVVWGFNKNAIKFYENIGMKIKNIKFEQKIVLK